MNSAGQEARGAQKEMNRFRFALAFLLGACLMGQSGWATEAYVSDVLKITLRTGPSVENKILAVLSSGQAVEILDTQGDWSLIRVVENDESSKEGWVMGRYLMNRVPWEMQAKSLKEENTALQEKLNYIEGRLVEAVRNRQKLDRDLQRNVDALGELEKKHEALRKGAEGYLKLKAVHASTQSTLERTQTELQELSAENEKLRSSQINKWFATGALVLLCGLLIGVIVGRQQKKRRSLYI